MWKVELAFEKGKKLGCKVVDKSKPHGAVVASLSSRVGPTRPTPKLDVMEMAEGVVGTNIMTFDVTVLEMTVDK